eukprot:COSAG02_NODE_1414_length_12746_cov_3.904698_10_plen_104_part_00
MPKRLIDKRFWNRMHSAPGQNPVCKARSFSFLEQTHPNHTLWQCCSHRCDGPFSDFSVGALLELDGDEEGPYLHWPQRHLSCCVRVYHNSASQSGLLNLLRIS